MSASLVGPVRRDPREGTLSRRRYRLEMSAQAAIEELASAEGVELFDPALAGSDHREAVVLEPHPRGFILRRQDLESPAGLRPVSHALVEATVHEYEGATDLAIELRVDPRPLPPSTAQRLWLVMAMAMSVPFLPLIAISSMALPAKVAAYAALLIMHVALARVIHVWPARKQTREDAKELGAIVEGTFAALEREVEGTPFFRA